MMYSDRRTRGRHLRWIQNLSRILVLSQPADMAAFAQIRGQTRVRSMTPGSWTRIVRCMARARTKNT